MANNHLLQGNQLCLHLAEAGLDIDLDYASCNCLRAVFKLYPDASLIFYTKCPETQAIEGSFGGKSFHLEICFVELFFEIELHGIWLSV